MIFGEGASIAAWRQHQSLPEGEPNFRYLLDFPRLPAALSLPHLIVHVVEDGGNVFTPKTIYNVKKTHIMIPSR